MQIELRNISEIKPYEKNPRINDDAVDAVAKSLQEFGFRQPIVVDADGCRSTRSSPRTGKPSIWQRDAGRLILDD